VPNQNQSLPLTIQDVARRTGLSAEGVRGAVRDGRLRVNVRTEGGIRLFTAEDVADFIRRREERTGPAKTQRAAR